jgi:hypothetical protein
MPALFQSTSNLVSFERKFSADFLTVARSFKSRCKKISSPFELGKAALISAIASSAFSIDRPVMYTFASCEYRISASSLPTPLEEPVTMKT